MQKSLIVFVTFFWSTVCLAQLNPITNLYFNQWYECPNNYFALTWSVAVHSEDTLLGFNIYRNDELYRFQTENFLHHEPYGDSNCSEAFLYIDCCDELWIHVTAVYNRDSAESEYFDSVFSYGLALNINRNNSPTINIYPNPTKDFLFVDSDAPENTLIFDNKGILQLQTDFYPIDLRELGCGIFYVILITSEKQRYIKRIEIIR